MSKFFVESCMISDGYVTLTREDSQHFAKVLRGRPGEEITVCDDKGYEYKVEVSSVTKNEVAGKIIETMKNETEPKIQVTLFQGLAKGSKMEYIIQKCVEVGVCSIVPVATKRAVVKLNEEKGKDKEERWNKISVEAAKQSSRGIIPMVESPLSFEEAVLKAGEYDLAIIPYEKNASSGLKELLRESSPKKIAVFIGPEGGFEESEIELAEKNGIKPVGLGKRILRTETAPISVISVLMYEYDWE